MNQDISRFLESIDTKSIDPLVFLSEKGIKVNVNQIYLQRKIISQLSVRDHILNMGPALKIPASDTKLILAQLIDAREKPSSN